MNVRNDNAIGGGAVQAEKTGRAYGAGPHRFEADRAGNASSPDTVILSEAAQASTRIAEMAAGRRAARIARLEADVKNGSYVADSAEISRKLVEDALTGGETGPVR